MGWKALLTIGLLLAIPAHADEKSALAIWQGCVLTKAQQYAKGHDAAPVVVNGALAACFDRQKDFAQAMRQMPMGQAVAAIEEIRKTLSDAALVEILEKRSAP